MPDLAGLRLRPSDVVSGPHGICRGLAVTLSRNEDTGQLATRMIYRPETPHQYQRQLVGSSF
ncbi:protein of unknown function [Pseudorhizobium banfieldiae]|uniref:Uncharacterized protein n=1 Tax=Pseudorhizobium banfieldiae TaxID=1125847 RepID=L0NJZ4_9HYPH|nr:protein of unknown function [Pseudorhizobium banfieldiae]